MIPKQLEELYKDVPRSIPPTVPMSEPNQEINIYDGPITLKNDKGEIQLEGRIKFTWYPNPGSILTGTLTKEIEEWNTQEYDVFVDGLHYGKCTIINISVTNYSAEMPIKARFGGTCILGDKSIPVNYIDFSIPNLRQILGANTVHIENDRLTAGTTRLEFATDDFKIILDSIPEHREGTDKVTWKGGYLNLYGGRIIRANDQAIKYDRAIEVIHVFSRFISFLNGYRTAPLFLQGIHENKAIWKDYSAYIVSDYRSVRSYLPQRFNEGIVSMWNKFYQFSKNKNDSYALDTAVHWYNEANCGSGFGEGSMIMAQAALELLYNWILIENKKILKGKDTENIAASNKIRLLLNQLPISYNVPDSYPEMQKFVSDTDNVEDAPDAIVYIRNAIVHAQLEKRKKLADIPDVVIYQALELTLWYIEMTLLNMLGYNSVYRDRRSEVNREILVPWVDQNSQLT